MKRAFQRAFQWCSAEQWRNWLQQIKQGHQGIDPEVYLYDGACALVSFSRRHWRNIEDKKPHKKHREARTTLRTYQSLERRYTALIHHDSLEAGLKRFDMNRLGSDRAHPTTSLHRLAQTYKSNIRIR